MLKSLLENQWAKYALTLAIGVTVGAVFYPTKRIEEKISQKYEQQISTLKESHSSEIARINENYNETKQEFKEYKQESEHKISTLSVTIKNLESKQKTAYYKIVRPDGTIEEKQFTETEVKESSKVITQIQEEFKTKIASIEQKWTDIHKARVTEIVKTFDAKETEYKHTIAELQKSKVTTVNEKHFGIEAGILTNKDYYGHATMDVWGPVFLGVHGQLSSTTNNNEVGAGIGIRF